MANSLATSEGEYSADLRFFEIFEALDLYQQDFLNHFDYQILQRGIECAEGGRVKSVSIDRFTHRELQISSEVQGDRRYAVSITLKVSKSGLEKGWRCSCPHHAVCKHTVATLWQFFDQGWTDRLKDFMEASSATNAIEDQPEPINREFGLDTPHGITNTSVIPLSKQCERWLDSIQKKSLQPRRSETGPWCDVGYVLKLNLNAPPDALVDWVISAAPILDSLPDRPMINSGDDLRDLIAAGGVNFAPEDAQILIRLGVLSLQRPSYANSFNYSETLTAAKSADLLLKVIATNRCFLFGTSMKRLSIGPQQQVRLGWRRALEDNLSTCLSGLAPGMRILMTEKGCCYLDVQAGCVGEVVAEEKNVAPQVWLKTPRVKVSQGRSLVIEARKRGLPIDGLEGVVGDVAIPQLGTPQVVVKVFATANQVPPIPAQWQMSDDGIGVVANLNQEQTYLHAISVAFRYGETEVPSLSKQQLLSDPANKNIQIMRNSEVEQQALNQLLSLGAGPLGHQPYTQRLATRGLYGVRYQYEDYMTDLLRFVSRLRAHATSAGWTVSVPSNLIPIEIPQDSWEGSLVESQEGSWFDAALSIEAQGQRIDMGEIMVHLLDGNNLTRLVIQASKKENVIITLPNCSVQVDRQRLLRLLRLVEELSNRESGQALRFDRYAAYAFENALQDSLGKWESPVSVAALRERIASIEQRDALPEPQQFQGTLRDYQHQGLSWLSAISNAELGGILADDMGLGKTVQLIALMLQERAQNRTGINLVVCPKSVEPNWISELNKFAPSLRVRRATGEGRIGVDEQLSDTDVVVITYPILLRDAKALSQIDFNIAIFDEAQAIKNPSTLSYSAARAIKARVRLPVSGTPIENNLKDLWAHFNLMMPGFLSSLKHFEKVYRKPIEKNGDQEMRQHLAARVHPFILRRTKTEVAKELPPLTEIVQRCSLEGAQRDLYETIRQLTTKRVREALATKGAKRSHIEFLDALLKLRQACCDPALVKTASAKKVKISAKRATLMELLQTLLAEERSVIIFSQFTSMLALIEEEIRQKQIPYVMLTGDTEDRETPVKAFQAGEARVFLMSLKAGGVGVNLTAADAIIMYDPWWNPAVEAQAICRAHRIGQKKPVFAYRLIAEGTVEERILDLQARKRALVENILTENERPPELTSELIDYLFAPIGE